MPFQAKNRFAKIAPRKARLLMNLIRGRDVECGDSAVGWSGDMDFVGLFLVIRPDHLYELGENAGSVIEKQLIAGRGGSDPDVAPDLSLPAEVLVQT
mgnify:CR=1 FL=1